MKLTLREKFKYNNDKLKKLLKELPKRGFIPADVDYSKKSNYGNHPYKRINTTYLCVKKGTECNFYDTPTKYINNCHLEC
ncbi:MAG: hypothetical protein SLAVMIC_00035 [uncultured marine phage]|uniref:Uncharacterized protein n=1 Tax=uncultured marine phage TaxID=707152 RepID=A0A8D9CAY4_9VIRU|nr:MAG: hypothetical protein SLAVMIC_00035 [uncultured marine phage]